jgi:hypothetical protein
MSPRRFAAFARVLAPAFVLASAAAAGTAHATVLTFESVSQLGPINNPSYGDRVTTFGPGLGAAGGATPNIVLDFVPTGSASPFSVYSSGYSGLVSALGHGSFNVPGYVEFTPDAGWDVVLTSFDLGAWSSSSYPNSRIQVVDTGGTLHFDSGVFTFPAITVLSYLPTPIRSSLPLRLVALPRNVGLTAALNAGLEEVTQPWVLRFDSDDICLPQRIEAQLACIARGEVDVFGAQIAEFDTDPKQPTRSRQVPCTHAEIRRFAMRRNPFNHMTMCYRKAQVDAVGGYPSIPWMEDYALWLKLLATGARTANLPEVLVLARVGNGMVARRGGWRYVRSEWALQALMRRLGLKPAWRAALDGSLRSAAFLLPVAARERVYRHLLRRGAPASGAGQRGSAP